MQRFEFAPGSGGEAGVDWPSRIKRFRVDRCLTQAALAELLNVDPSTVCRWERGRDRPDLGMQRRLRELTEPPANPCPNCREAIVSASMLLQLLADPEISMRFQSAGAECKFSAGRQVARSILDRLNRKGACHDEG